MFPDSANAQASGVVTMMSTYEPPVLLSFVSTASVIWSARTTEGLLEFDHDLKPQPLLATEWSISEDGLTYTFKLRQGVKWHDGEDFTSEDVAFSLETMKQFHPRHRSTLAYMESIETPDDHTVILNLSKPTPFLLMAMTSVESPIVPKHRYKEGEDVLTHPNNTAPIGTGPYVFKDWVRGSHVEWTANPNYWDKGFPLVQTLIGKVIGDGAARTIAFENGEVDIGYQTPVPLRDLDRLGALPHIVIEPNGYQYNPPTMFFLEPNWRESVFQDERVRQAIAHSIDREELSRIVHFGRSTPCAAPISPAMGEFHLAEPTPYGFDLQKAEQLLLDAGYKPDADGFLIKLTLDCQQIDDHRLVGEYLRAAFERAKIKIELRTQDQSSLIKRIYTDNDFQLALGQFSPLFDPQLGVQRTYWSKNIIKGVPFSNGSGYSNAEVDRLLEEAAVSVDHAQRVKNWHEVQRIVMRELGNFPLFASIFLTIANKRVTDHSITAEGYLSNLSRIRIVS